jgi:pSer/pThr/pTyr-binding forkhead associated (FHA) protein
VFKLTIEDDEGKTTVIPVIRDEMSIGRQEGNTIRLTERNVSRRHARILRQNGSIFIEDLASFTGVKVNGAKIAVLTPVHEGDEVQIGDYKLMVRADRPAVAVDGDRATTPSMPSSVGPMATVGGSVAIPTRATAAAMAAQAAAAAAAPAPAAPPVNGGPAPGRPTSNGGSVAPAEPPGAPDPIEAQPTIPVRTLGEAGFTGPEAEAAPPARLVVLTTELAGMEFELNRASLVIGRTDENEVVLNHRSISRHHAKVVREGNRYTIVDLQSANGVRVNGEDYERIELHPADVIELGHVKLRFVGAFEHYVFDPSARYDAGRFPTKIAVSVAGVAVLAVIAIAALRGGRPRSAEAEGAAVAVAPGQPAAPAAAPSPAVPAVATTPVAPVPSAAPPTGPMTPEALLAEANRAMGVEDWDAARSALDRLGTQDAGPGLHRRATDLRRRVDSERQAAVAFAHFDEAQTAKAYADAVARYADIPADSVYKRRARARFEEARSLLVTEHLTAAERARTSGRCQDVKAEVDEIERLDPQNTLGKEMLHLCRPRAEPLAVVARPPRAKPAAVLAAQTSPSRPERAERAEPATRRAEAAASEPAGDADDLMKQAREAWLRQQCGSAIDLSRKALRARPGMTDAFQIIAVCSCSLKDADGATRAYGKLDDKSRNLVRSLCQRNGITVGQD